MLSTCTVLRENVKKNETKGTIAFVVTFLSLVGFQLGRGRATWALLLLRLYIFCSAKAQRAEAE